MQIVILHCHYERGGVTQVVENHVRAICTSGDVQQIALVSGDRVSGLSSETNSVTTQLVLNDFDYDPAGLRDGGIQSRVGEIRKQLEQGLASIGIDKHQAVLHWHNHSLGKNTAAPGVIASMADSGWRMLLQIHDYAEDFRPENYLRLIQATGAKNRVDLDSYLYPVAPQINYATLTRADGNVLRAAGVPADRIHCLPNSVRLPDSEMPSWDEAIGRVRRVLELPDQARWCLYPVRGIRRKNVGEFVLLCRWLGENGFGGLTLCPATPVEKRSYERWREVAQYVSPRAVFDAAHHDGISFTDNLAASDYIISTSVAEGFGMAYLEPWLAHRGVIGRRLPTVMDDFVASGVCLPTMYESVEIPGDAEWVRTCGDEIDAALRQAWSGVPESFQPAVPEQPGYNDSIDFAKLTPTRQESVLRRMNDDPGFDSAVRERSRTLINFLGGQIDQGVVQSNEKVVRRHYSIERQGKELLRLYRTLANVADQTHTTAPENAGKVLDLVLRARPFYPCRTEILK